MINKPINSSPHNSCVAIPDGVTIKYDIPNSKKIDGRYISVNNLETGETTFESYEEFSEPKNSVEWVVSDELPETNSEFSWESFYWQTPTKPSKKWTVSNDVKRDVFSVKANISDESNKVALMQGFNDPIQTSNNGYRYESPYCYILPSGNYRGVDGTAVFYKNNKEDYYGYPYFWGTYNLREKIQKIGLGKCIIEAYVKNNDENEKMVARAKILGVEYLNNNYGLLNAVFIIDNPNFYNQLNQLEQISLWDSNTGELLYTTIPKIDSFLLYSEDDLIKNEDIHGLLKHNEKYYFIRDVSFNGRSYSLTTLPKIIDSSVGDTIEVWDFENANYNISPTYYFRTKQPPDLAIKYDSKIRDVDGGLYLGDTKCKFGLDYSSQQNEINYYYLYLYVFNPKTYDWVLKEKSGFLYSTEETHEFVGFMDGQKYKICGVCVDNDGDEWVANDIIFTVDNSALSVYDIPAKFNDEDTTIEIFLDNVLSVYKNASLEFYRVHKSDVSPYDVLEYAGGGLCKTGGENGLNGDTTYIHDGNIVSYNKWCDYNIRNDSYYDYYVRVEYAGRNYDIENNPVDATANCNIVGDEASLGVDFILVRPNIHTSFKGTSILGLEKKSETLVGIVQSFNLFYRFENEMNELNNELSRDYINSFNKYPRELKGQQNYISGQYSGLLGYEEDGVYIEPKGIKDLWNEFINDETIKLYRGVDGETMIISIESSRVKPEYYPNIGLVNSVNLTFKEIESTRKYAIFKTEKIGD